MAKQIEKLETQLVEMERLIEEGDFVPKSANGSQKTPNAIRSDIQKYLASNKITRTKFLYDISVNSNSYGKFMNAAYYKSAWSACENGTYWAAAKFLAVYNLREKINALKVTAAEKAHNKVSKRSATTSGLDEGGDSCTVLFTPAKKAKPAVVQDTEVVTAAEMEKIMTATGAKMVKDIEKAKLKNHNSKPTVTYMEGGVSGSVASTLLLEYLSSRAPGSAAPSNTAKMMKVKLSAEDILALYPSLPRSNKFNIEYTGPKYMHIDDRNPRKYFTNCEIKTVEIKYEKKEQMLSFTFKLKECEFDPADYVRVILK